MNDRLFSTVITAIGVGLSAMMILLNIWMGTWYAAAPWAMYGFSVWRFHRVVEGFKESNQRLVEANEQLFTQTLDRMWRERGEG